VSTAYATICDQMLTPPLPDMRFDARDEDEGERRTRKRPTEILPQRRHLEELRSQGVDAVREDRDLDENEEPVHDLDLRGQEREPDPRFLSIRDDSACKVHVWPFDCSQSAQDGDEQIDDGEAADV